MLRTVKAKAQNARPSLPTICSRCRRSGTPWKRSAGLGSANPGGNRQNGAIFFRVQLCLECEMPGQIALLPSAGVAAAHLGAQIREGARPIVIIAQAIEHRRPLTLAERPVERVHGFALPILEGVRRADRVDHTRVGDRLAAHRDFPRRAASISLEQRTGRTGFVARRAKE